MSYLRSFRQTDIEDRDALAESYYYTALAELGRADEAAARRALEGMLDTVPDPASEGYAVTLLLSLYAKAGLSDELLERANAIDRAQLEERWRPNLVLYEAEAYYAQGRLDEAIPRYRRSEQAPPELATLAFQRLFQLAQDDRIPEEPADVLRRAEQALAGRTDVLKAFWLRVGIDSYTQGRYDLAELYFRRIWDFRGSEFIPASVPLYLSRLLDGRGDPGGAEEVLAGYLDLYGEQSPERLRVLIALGNLQLRLGRVSDAVATLEAAFDGYEAGPYFAEAAYQYAFALRRAGRNGEALAAIDSAFSAGRTGGIQADLLRLRATVLRDLGREAAALQALFEYIPLRPADAQAAVEYVNLLFSLERYARVVDEVPAIVDELTARDALTPSIESRLSYVLGLALVNERAYEEAAGVLRANSRARGSIAGRTAAVRALLRRVCLVPQRRLSRRRGDLCDAARRVAGPRAGGSCRVPRRVEQLPHRRVRDRRSVARARPLVFDRRAARDRVELPARPCARGAGVVSTGGLFVPQPLSGPPGVRVRRRRVVRVRRGAGRAREYRHRRRRTASCSTRIRRVRSPNRRRFEACGGALRTRTVRRSAGGVLLLPNELPRRRPYGRGAVLGRSGERTARRDRGSAPAVGAPDRGVSREPVSSAGDAGCSGRAQRAR